MVRYLAKRKDVRKLEKMSEQEIIALLSTIETRLASIESELSAVRGIRNLLEGILRELEAR